MSPSIYDPERPHLNEAALLAGTNPELEAAEQHRARAQVNLAPRDSVLQTRSRPRYVARDLPEAVDF